MDLEEYWRNRGYFSCSYYPLLQYSNTPTLHHFIDGRDGLLVYNKVGPSVLGPCFFIVPWIKRFLLAVTDCC